MKVKQKPVVTYKMSGEAESETRTRLECRDLMDISDEPEARGGTNEGFAPTEFVMGGLIACTNVITHKIAAKHNIEIEELTVDLVAKFNNQGVTLQEEIDVPFPEMKLIINIKTNASDEEIETLKTNLPKYCAVSKIIHQCGTDLKSEWNVTRP